MFTKQAKYATFLLAAACYAGPAQIETLEPTIITTRTMAPIPQKIAAGTPISCRTVGDVYQGKTLVVPEGTPCTLTTLPVPPEFTNPFYAGTLTLTSLTLNGKVIQMTTSRDVIGAKAVGWLYPWSMSESVVLSATHSADTSLPAHTAAQRSTPVSLVVIPDLTLLRVRTVDPIDSKKDELGQKYRASLAQPIFVDGKLIVPRGADCVLVLKSEEKGHRLTGKSKLKIALQNITIDGKPVEVTATPFTTDSRSKTKGTVGAISGGAGLGAIVGALAGGGTGAGIGALAGGGAGLLSRVVVSGPHVKVPSETELGFQLQKPISIQ